MHRYNIVVAFFLGLLLTGCAVRKYKPAPISLSQSAESLQSRQLSDPGLREFLSSQSQHPPTVWPTTKWNLENLTLAAFYYSPALQIAKAHLSEAEAAIVTAGARPNPSLSGDLGGESISASPWIVGLGFSLPIETAGKRRHRISQAELLADSARWNVANTAWAVRSQVRNAMLEYVFALKARILMRSEEGVRVEQVRLLRQRLDVGLIPRPEVDNAQIQHTQSLLTVRAVEGRISQAEAALAAAMGVPVAALEGIDIIWPTLNDLPSIASLSRADIQKDAVLNRLDIRRALADYAASESALQLEIAKQYPDVELGPNYAFEEGTHLYSLAARLVLPIFNRNQGPIAEAFARRESIAAQFISVQAAGIAESEQALARYTSALNELSEARQLLQQSVVQEQAALKALQEGESDRVALNGTQLQTVLASIAEQETTYRAQKALGDLENSVQRPLEPGDIEALSPQSPVLKPATRK